MNDFNLKFVLESLMHYLGVVVGAAGAWAGRAVALIWAVKPRRAAAGTRTRGFMRRSPRMEAGHRPHEINNHPALFRPPSKHFHQNQLQIPGEFQFPARGESHLFLILVIVFGYGKVHGFVLNRWWRGWVVVVLGFGGHNRVRGQRPQSRCGYGGCGRTRGAADGKVLLLLLLLLLLLKTTLAMIACN